VFQPNGAARAADQDPVLELLTLRARPAPKAPAKNLQAVDLARTLAILPVLALHATPWLLAQNQPTTPWSMAHDQGLPELWDHLQRNGAYGVSVFFLISGFLITRILDREKGGAFKAGWRKFYAHRAGRILPLLALDMLVGLAFWLFWRDDSKLFKCCFHLPQRPADPTFWVPLLFFAFNWARAYFSLNRWGDISLHWGVLWSLAVEEQFYLFYPWILRVLKRPRNLVLFFLGLLLAAGLWGWFVMKQPLDNGLDWKWGSFGYFDQIGMGMGLYFLQKQAGAWLSHRPWAAWGLTLLGLAGFGFVYGETSSADLTDFFFAPPLAAASIGVALLGALNLSFFESRFFWVFSLPGKYSYGNYLLHTTVIYFLTPRLAGGNIYLVFLIFASASTAVAALSFHAFEVPANRWVRRLLKCA